MQSTIDRLHEQTKIEKSVIVIEFCDRLIATIEQERFNYNKLSYYTSCDQLFVKLNHMYNSKIQKIKQVSSRRLMEISLGIFDHTIYNGPYIKTLDSYDVIAISETTGTYLENVIVWYVENVKMEFKQRMNDFLNYNEPPKNGLELIFEECRRNMKKYMSIS